MEIKIVLTVSLTGLRKRGQRRDEKHEHKNGSCVFHGAENSLARLARSRTTKKSLFRTNIKAGKLHPGMFEYLLDPILNFFDALWNADKRPDARRFSIGCLFIMLILAGLLAWIFWDVDTGPPR